MTTFVDTSALFAVLDKADPRHADAARVLTRLAGTEELLTHGYVVSETIALVQRRLGADAVRALVERLLPSVPAAMVDEHTHATGLAALAAALPTTVSFVDLVSFEFMRERGIVRAFAFDEDFERAGFETLK